MAEQMICNHQVPGSRPGGGSNTTWTLFSIVKPGLRTCEAEIVPPSERIRLPIAHGSNITFIEQVDAWVVGGPERSPTSAHGVIAILMIYQKARCIIWRLGKTSNHEDVAHGERKQTAVNLWVRARHPPVRDIRLGSTPSILTRAFRFSMFSTA